MLYIVLGLVLAAFGLLIAALTTANTLWAWLSVVVSIGAAGVLVYDWLRNRREAEAAKAAAAPAEPKIDHHAREDAEPATPVDATGSATVADAPPPPPPPPAVDAPSGEVPVVAADPVPTVDSDEEPPEEQTDATDLLVVSGLYAEVRVVDERPGYHLAKCSWLNGRPTLPLPVSEARQLGFTPCAICGPDAVLARRHREGAGSRRS
jgi:hypothetical protein